MFLILRSLVFNYLIILHECCNIDKGKTVRLLKIPKHRWHIMRDWEMTSPWSSSVVCPPWLCCWRGQGAVFLTVVQPRQARTGTGPGSGGWEAGNTSHVPQACFQTHWTTSSDTCWELQRSDCLKPEVVLVSTKYTLNKHLNFTWNRRILSTILFNWIPLIFSSLPSTLWTLVISLDVINDRTMYQ